MSQTDQTRYVFLVILEFVPIPIAIRDQMPRNVGMRHHAIIFHDVLAGWHGILPGGRAVQQILA